MTSDKEPKKTQWFDAKSEVTKEAVEETVAEAVVEAKEHVEEFHYKYDLGDDGCITAISPELYEAVQPKKMDVHMIRALRANDRSFNKTCSECARRVPLETIQGGKADVCDACMEK